MAEFAYMQIRRGEPGDLPFVFNSWLQSSAESAWGRSMRRRVYFRRHHSVIQRLLKRAELWVAVLPEAPDVILGWMVAEPEAKRLHYVYVKESWRGFSIARSLLEHLPEVSTYTHRTLGPQGRVERLIREHYPNIIYDPYGAFEEGE